MPDWSERECSTLLGRPIFDAAIYGSVRFHHRSVREYLTAEWLSEILKNKGSRRNIESLFLSNQYGIQVIKPSMKPVLSWLVLFDDKIRKKVSRIEPEIFLEGGDPSQLHIETRKEILKSVCHKIASNSTGQSVTDYAAVQRFSNPDMADDINALIKIYNQNQDITSFLMRMIWQGRIKRCLATAKRFALDNQAEKYTRIAAIRAVKEVGDRLDYDEILQSFASSNGMFDRRLLAEMIDNLDLSENAVNWIFEVLEKAENKKRHSVDDLSRALAKFVERIDTDIAGKFINGAVRLLNQPPVIERNNCEISERFGWLMESSTKAIEKLILSRHPVTLEGDSLSILTKIHAFNEYTDFGYRVSLTDDMIRKWDELNHALFWKNVEETRKHLHAKDGERLTNFWQVAIYGHLWGFDKNDFELIKTAIVERKFIDDRLVALSLAFQLYTENNRPRVWSKQLKKLVSDEEVLRNKLDELLRPPTQSKEDKKWIKQRANRKQQDKERKQKNRDEWFDFLTKNYRKLCDEKLAKKGILSKAQYYLLEHLRKLKDDSNHWSGGNWSDLVGGFGEDVATAYREGLLNFWRNYQPALRSEMLESNGTSCCVIFGLAGLEVEFNETSNWHIKLSEQDAGLACRYAFWEINGLPHWFPKLHASFRDIVVANILKEIEWELNAEDPENEKHYLLSTVSWHCQWLWNDIAPHILNRLKKEPLNLQNLGHLLTIVQSSSIIADEDISKLASRKCKSLRSLDHVAHWFAAWIGVNPEFAIENLTTYLAQIENRNAAVEFAMTVIVKLVGERMNGSSAREAFKAPTHLQKLYLLMLDYIKIEHDINRAGTGVYTPNLHDNAQQARDRLFLILKDISGKESYLALVELSKVHPEESEKPWMMVNARKRAEQDADMSVWTGEKFLEFNKYLDSTPSNHRELFDLAVQKLLDLKYDLEDGDNSISPILIKEKEETKIRNFIGGWCRDNSFNRYSIQQEEELADAKRPDIRFLCLAVDAPVPVELKLADNWSAQKLLEGLEHQLCGDYLRDVRSNQGIFLLVYRGEKTFWKIPNGNQNANFSEIVEALNNHWKKIFNNYPKIEQIEVIGIDLTMRNRHISSASF